MSKNGKIVDKFLEKLSQTCSAFDTLSMDLEDEADCCRDQAVLVMRSCLLLSKYVKSADVYLKFLRRSAKDRTDEVRGWLDDWKLLKVKMDESYRYMRSIVWVVDECSYKGSDFYHECLDEISASLVERAGENVRAFGRLRKSAEELMKEARGMMCVWKKREEERRRDEDEELDFGGGDVPLTHEELQESISPCFYDRGKVDEFLQLIEGKSNSDVTAIVKDWVSRRLISDLSCHTTLWRPLYRAGKYKASIQNWNIMIK